MCGIGGVGQVPVQVGQVAGANGSPEQSPTQVAGATGGGGMSGDALARLQEALKGLQEMIAGISGGGPGKPTQVGGEAGKGVEQVGQVGQVGGANGSPVQGGGHPGQVGQSAPGKRFGKHGMKPGYGNGGFGAPGQIKKQGSVGGAHGMPTQAPPFPGKVGGDSGPGKPAQVGGDSGPGKPGQVGGDSGPGKPGQVGGDSGPGKPTQAVGVTAQISVQ